MPDDQKKRCMTIQKILQLSDMFSWIFSEIPQNMPDTKIIRRVQISCTIVRLFFGSSCTYFGIVRHLWDCPALFLGLSSIFFWISCLFLVYKKEPKQVKVEGGGFKVFKGVLYSLMWECAIEVSIVIMWTIPLNAASRICVKLISGV